MSRIATLAAAAEAADRSLLIPYLVSGDPTIAHTAALMHELVAVGADIIELGVPFSDPSSDGPVIQRGVERALSAGTTLRDTLAAVAQFRQTDQNTAIVLMGYLNPVEIMGYETFANEAAVAGVDGVLLVDMPPAESEPLHGLLQQQGIDSIYLVAPTTTTQRRAQIVARCSGYLYYVSLKGVTGAAMTDNKAVAASISQLRSETDLPIVVGFGIKDAPSARAMGDIADGVVVGSVLVDRIGKLDAASVDGGAVAEACAIIKDMRVALDA